MFKGREGYLIVGMPLTRVSAPELSPFANDLAETSTQEQIDDLAVMSREYERQEALRMAGGDASTDSSSRQSEPYINEIVPVHLRSGRRPASHDSRQGR